MAQMTYSQCFLNYLRNTKNSIQKWLDNSELTICHELHRQGLMTSDQLEMEINYAGTYVSKTIKYTYLILVIPVVWVMQKSVRVTKLAYHLATRFWLNKVWSHMSNKDNA